MRRNRLDNFGQRLKQARMAAGLTQEKLGELLDVAERNIRCYEAGSKSPALHRLHDLARATGCDVGFFFGGPTRVPLYDEVPAGPAIEPLREVRASVAVPDEWIGSGAPVYCLRVRESSMEPLLHHGDVIAVRPQPDADHGQVVVASLASGEYVVKRLAKQRGGRAVLTSLNAAHADIITDAFTRIAGRVIGVIRSL